MTEMISGKMAAAAFAVFSISSAWLTAGEAPSDEAPKRVERPLDAGVVDKMSKNAGNWLISQYNLKQGTFGKGKGVAMPGMVALVVHALCTTPLGQPYREDDGPFISEPVEYLLRCQQENGAIALKNMGLETYNTSLAIMALKAVENPKYAEVIDKAQKYLLACQSKEEKPNRLGGFRYGEGKGEPDLNNTLYALEALKAAGIKSDSPAFQNALKFIRNCIDDPELSLVAKEKGALGSGGATYRPGESEIGKDKNAEGKMVARAYGSMTYNMVKALLLCDVKKDSPELQAAFRWIKSNYTVEENPGAGAKGYYYYVLAFAKALSAAGLNELTTSDGRTVCWASELAAQLKKLQKKDGSFVNDREEKWMENDPILCTAYALEALNLCHAALKAK
jgi:squalene-hopene/tetraprenyl-beta-curcumene cyclase